jgi:hypothetical protein
MPKYSSGLAMFQKVLITAGPALSLLVWISVISMVIFGYLTYYTEGAMTYSVDERWLADYPTGVYIRPTVDGHDWEVTPFRSIPDCFWYVCTTITSVGYGDFFPTTVAGRITGGILFYVGIINLALPVTIIGTSFMLYYHDWVQEHITLNHPAVDLQEAILATPSAASGSPPSSANIKLSTSVALDAQSTAGSFL